jgi:hypothetical protein
MVNVLNGLTACDALCLLVGCMLTVLDEAPSDEDSLWTAALSCFDALRTAYGTFCPLMRRQLYAYEPVSIGLFVTHRRPSTRKGPMDLFEIDQ